MAIFNVQTINSARSKSELISIRNKLYNDRMKMDKFFSVFLENNEMDEEDLNTPEWITYREMLKDYERVQSLILRTNYRIEHS